MRVNFTCHIVMMHIVALDHCWNLLKGYATILVLPDLSGAFDIVDHKNLLDRLENWVVILEQSLTVLFIRPALFCYDQQWNDCNRCPVVCPRGQSLVLFCSTRICSLRDQIIQSSNMK